MEDKAEKLKFTPEINHDWGYTSVFLDRNFSFKHFFIVEDILRKKAKFKISRLFLSEIKALFETWDNTFFIERKFTYNGSKLVLACQDQLLFIEPQARKSATKEDNDNAIEISNLLLKELDKKT